jgi:hypothetical protein
MAENEKQWFVDMQSEIVGPVSLDMLRNWFRVKTITSETWVRQEGQSEWHPLAMVEELDMSEEGIADLEDLADQPNAEKTPHYLRTFEDLADQSNAEKPFCTLTEEYHFVSERDRLLNRAFGVSCIVNILLALGLLTAFVYSWGNADNAVVAVLLFGLLSIPVLLQYYLLNSIVISLRAITKLMDRLDEREKTQENTKNKN